MPKRTRKPAVLVQRQRGAEAMLEAVTSLWRDHASEHPGGLANGYSVGVFNQFIEPLGRIFGLLDDQIKHREGLLESQEVKDLMVLRLDNLTNNQKKVVVSYARQLGVDVPKEME